MDATRYILPNVIKVGNDEIESQQEIQQAWQQQRQIKYCQEETSPPYSLFRTTLKIDTNIDLLFQSCLVAEEIMSTIREPVMASIYMLAVKIKQLDGDNNIDLALQNVQNRSILIAALENRLSIQTRNKLCIVDGEQHTIHEYLQMIVNMNDDLRPPIIDDVPLDPSLNNAVRPSGIQTPILYLIIKDLCQHYQFYGKNGIITDGSHIWLSPYRPQGTQINQNLPHILLWNYQVTCRYDQTVNVYTLNQLQYNTEVRNLLIPVY
jgi:hypothetical protein